MTSSIFRRRATALSLAAVLTLGVAGCGDTEATSPGAKAATSTQGKATAVQAAAVGEQLLVDAYEAAEKAGSAHLSMKATGSAEVSAEGDVSYGGDDPTMQLTMSMSQMGSGKAAMRFVDGILYVQVPGMTPAGKFLMLDPKDENSMLGKMLAGVTEQLDPLEGVRQLQGAVTRSERVGETTVDGVAVDEYDVTVDTEKLMAKHEKSMPHKDIPKSVTYKLWLDDQSLIRKMSFDVAGASVEILVSKWGEPVKVEKPAPGDITRRPIS